MATPRQVAVQLNRDRSRGPPAWVYDPRSRGLVNAVSGARISRRQLDKQYGVLAEEGHASYEAKAEARRATGMRGFRRTRAGVFELEIDDPRKRKAILRGLPPNTLVQVLVRGHVNVRGVRSPGGEAEEWRPMNFAQRQGRARPMTAADMLSVWDNRASKAQSRQVRDPTRWIIRVYR